ncbi:hypothetical protein [Tenacibaculum discolor]|uniref:hypothetical protein n=1 Tax=Tenacibaculum discolor TaxID=361581 RepID=UPI003F7ADB97
MKKKLILFSTIVLSMIVTSIKAQVGETEIAPGEFKAINIGTNNYSTHSKSVILLHEVYNGIKISKNYAVGEIHAFRGSTGGNNRTNIAKVNTSSAYTHTNGTIISVNSSGKWELKTVNYNGKKYLAAHVPYRADQHTHAFRFFGRSSSTGEAMKLIVYEDDGEVINSEIYNSMQDYTSNMAEHHDVSKFIVNGNVGVGTTNPYYLLQVEEEEAYNNTEYLLGSFKQKSSGGVYLGYVGDGNLSKEARVRSGGNINLALGTTKHQQAILINNSNGNVGIGTTSIPTDYKLAIAGKTITEEVKVQLKNNWPDYVFTKEYKLPTLQEVEQYINEKGHLQNIPSAKEVAKDGGIELGEMNRKLLEKIEELTLYTIQQQKEIERLKKLEERIKILENKN